MRTSLVLVFTVTSAFFLAGCGGKQAAKKNEGEIINVMPTASGGPREGNSEPGRPVSGSRVPPAMPAASAPPVPEPGK